MPVLLARYFRLRYCQIDDLFSIFVYDHNNGETMNIILVFEKNFFPFHSTSIDNVKKKFF